MSTTATSIKARPHRSVAVTLAEALVAGLLSPLLLRVRLAHSDSACQLEFQLCSEFLSGWPFRFGMLARRVFYSRILQNCGTNPLIRSGTVFVYPQAELGNNVFIGNRCTIGLTSLGDDVLLAHNVSVLSGRRHHQRGDGGAMEDGEVRRVRIGHGVWLGAGSVVMADVGDRAIVGAGAVVVRPVPAGATVVGNPARLVGEVGRTTSGSLNERLTTGSAGKETSA